MRSNRSWKIGATLAVVIIGIQALGRPSANLLSMRASRFEMLDAMWPRSSDLMRYPSWASGQIEPDASFASSAKQCGGAPDLMSIAERVGDTRPALREKAESIYRTDIILAVADRASWWKVKSWLIGYGLGLWPGAIDQPSDYLTSDKINKARAFSDRWYQRTTSQIVCDAIRSGR